MLLDCSVSLMILDRMLDSTAFSSDQSLFPIELVDHCQIDIDIVNVLMNSLGDCLSIWISIAACWYGLLVQITEDSGEDCHLTKLQNKNRDVHRCC